MNERKAQTFQSRKQKGQHKQQQQRDGRQ